MFGNAASIGGKTNSAEQHYLRAFETFRKNGDRLGEGTVMHGKMAPF